MSKIKEGGLKYNIVSSSDQAKKGKRGCCWVILFVFSLLLLLVFLFIFFSFSFSGLAGTAVLSVFTNLGQIWLVSFKKKKKKRG